VPFVEVKGLDRRVPAKDGGCEADEEDADGRDAARGREDIADELDRSADGATVVGGAMVTGLGVAYLRNDGQLPNPVD